MPATNLQIGSQLVTVPSTPNPIPNPTSSLSSNPLPPPLAASVMTVTPPAPPPPPHPTQNTAIPLSHPVTFPDFATISTSSSTSSDEEPRRWRKRKRKWESFFQRLMTEVIEKQEEMQKKFLETLERRERDRLAREEAWRVQEMSRMNREHDLLVHERSIAAAKDAAVIAFLQKVSEQQIPNVTPQMQIQMQLAPPPPPPAQLPPTQPTPTPPLPPSQPPIQQPVKTLEIVKTDNRGEIQNEINVVPKSSSRWPKAEVQALIRLRTNLDLKYQETGPKGPLWEEISAAMRNLGYDRNPKRCKEKWENINKYFKKVKESNKRRSEDSKTCPYFHQLEALHREKTKNEGFFNPGGFDSKPENPMVPIMVQPEQQWPLSEEQQRRIELAMEDRDSGNIGDGDGDDDDEEGDEEEDEAGGYEIVQNKASSLGRAE
ncbi:Trihelix transcription factor df1 [Sarracenia purpurea var. burkii]